jgi:AraC-like DNA-binding protein
MHVSHYWLSLKNSDDAYFIAPDGCVDVVVVVGATTYRVDVFGTTTQNKKLPLDIGSHYLGIRFRPGQSRHFLNVKTRELTNAVQSADEALLPDLLGVVESVSSDSLFTRLDAVLVDHLKRQPPHFSRLDGVIRYMEKSPGSQRVSDLAQMCCKSRRQFERHFLEVAGLSPKLFLEIVRFRRACALLARSSLPLAQIAADLGYSDQSHLSHEFSRFYGLPPSRAREDVAFLQDATHLTFHNDSSCLTL